VIVGVVSELTTGIFTGVSLSLLLYMLSISAYRADHAMPDLDHTTEAVVVLHLRDRIFYSLTGVDWLKVAVAKIQAGGNLVLLADLDPSEREALDKTGLPAVLGEDNVVWRDAVIGAAAVTTSQRGEQWLSSRARL